MHTQKSLSHNPLAQISVETDSKAKHESFSSAKDFAAILAIPGAATVFFLAKHYFAYQNVAKPFDAVWFNHFWVADKGLFGHLLSFALLTFGLSSSLYLLHMVDKLKAKEEADLKRTKSL